MSHYDPIRARLEARKQELHQRIEQISADLRHEETPLTADFAEQAVEREEEEVQESLGSAARLELAQINRALQQMEDGEYGSCSDCGEAISDKRLEALPFATRCIDCAGRAERH